MLLTFAESTGPCEGHWSDESRRHQPHLHTTSVNNTQAVCAHSVVDGFLLVKFPQHLHVAHLHQFDEQPPKSSPHPSELGPPIAPHATGVRHLGLGEQQLS